MALDPDRIPVIVGVGQYNDRPDEPEEGLNSLELMIRALELADSDAGGNWVKDVDHLTAIAQRSWPDLGDVSTRICDHFDAVPGFRGMTPRAKGDAPVRLLNKAANLVRAGEIKIAAVVGGEGLRTAAQLAKKRGVAARSLFSPGGDTAYREKYGLVTPADLYALYENAGRAAYGQSLAEGQNETADIWTTFAEVARQNEGAWIRDGATRADILNASARNRPIAHPFNKLMVANSSVNQGAAYIVTSLAEAKRRGAPENRLVFVGHGAAANEVDDILQRDSYIRSASLEVSIKRALQLNAIEVDELDHVELYSCFPCVPKMARRVLGWPRSRPASVFGGLTFGGGPIANYMTHAIVSMTQCFRESGRYGLLFANGGIATSNHSIVLAARPSDQATAPQDFSYDKEADALRGSAPTLREDYAGPANIETYTVIYDHQGLPRSGAIVGRTPEGSRVLAKVPASDVHAIAFLTDGLQEPVGTAGRIIPAADGIQTWGF